VKKYVLDTSALLAYVENEDGAREVESLLEQAVDERVDLYISEGSCIEVYYIGQTIETALQKEN
jgi:PIN domain nuclease of toxin-antitoxin system